MHLITKIKNNSIAQELNIEVGDKLININHTEIKDIFDYFYLITDEYIEVVVQKANGEHWILEIEKDINEDLGITFEKDIMDDIKSCRNKCIFCFIDQLPDDMRKTLYFKDDDSRLSFLQGNYITFTNMNEDDINRIIFYHFSPINISVHTTDLEQRKFMLNNPNADNIIKYINKLYKAGIEMNFQIVLCKNINDVEYLEKTIEDLSKFIPKAKSLSIVPAGMTRYREENNLFKLVNFEKEDFVTTIHLVEKWQNILKQKYNTNFVFCSDEFYINANIPTPSYEHYEEFPQIENGVGMIACMQKEFDDELEHIDEISVIKPKKISIITGESAFNFISDISEQIMCKFKNININVLCIKNNFFGSQITVSGLITGQDILSQTENIDLGDYAIIPENMLRSGDTVFLDDLTLLDLENKLNIPIIAIKTTGSDFIKAIIG